jgi:hypothetical protein
VLLQLLAKRIEDKRFLKLIKAFLRAGYLEGWSYNRTYSGTPQGGTVSPILANVYLHELDEWLQEKADSFTKGKGRKYSAEYSRRYSRYKTVLNKARALKKAGRINEAKELEPEMSKRKADYLQCSPSDTQDPNFRRMRFIRYADDFVIGIIGSKAEARGLLENVNAFMTETLKVELAAEKTGVVHGSKGSRFLGYDIKIVTSPNRVVKTRGGTRRTMMRGIATLEWPMESVIKFAWERGYIDNIQDRKTRPRLPLLHLSEEEIITRYVQELRGVSNYYSRSKNWRHVGNRLHWLCKDSLARTLGKKNRTKRTLTYARYKMDDTFGVFNGKKFVALTPPKMWRRTQSYYADEKPRASVPCFQK